MAKKRAGEGGIEEAERELEGLRIRLAKKDFLTFLGYVKVLEPPPGRGTIQFEVWPHLREMVEVLKGNRLIVWTKSRQIGASWILAAYARWTAYQAGARVLMFSQGEEEAKVLLGKARQINTLLPEGLRGKVGRDTQQELEFPEDGSYIKALPSTEKAGRGETVSLAIFDEADRHEYLETAYNSVKPTLDDIGGQLIMVSTISAMTQTSLFKALYQGAPGNGYRKVFYGWRVRANRDASWLEQRRAEYTDKGLFEKEYPDDEDQAFAPPRSIAAFDHDRLNSMRLDVREPVERVMCGGVLANIYQGFQAGKRYVAGTDTSHGTGHDAAVTVVLDVVTGYVVADIKMNILPPDQLAEASGKLLGLYDNPTWGIEDNEWGVLTLATAQRMRYPRLYFREDGVVGWRTDERNRFTLWGELIEAIYSRLLTIPSAEGLSEFYTVIRNPEKRGRIEAQKGAHDDYPMALGIAWQMRRHARASGLGVRRERQPDFAHQGGGGNRKRGWTRW